MTQPALRTWHTVGPFEYYRTKKHLATLYVRSGKYNVTVLVVDKDIPYAFGNSFDTEEKAKTWIEHLS